MYFPLKEEKIRDFRRAYFSTPNLFGNNKLFVLNLKAPRFYVSPETALKNIRRRERNLHFVNALKMYEDLEKIYNDIRRKNPHLSKIKCMDMAVKTEAPRFYISYRRALEYLGKHH